jgi:hypothetical protein
MPTTLGNGTVVFGDSSTQTRSTEPSIVFSGGTAYNVLRTYTLNPTKATLFFTGSGGGEGGRSSFALGYRFGVNNGAVSGYTWFFNSGVDYQVFGYGATFKALPPGNSSLQLETYNNRVGHYGAVGAAETLVIQF